VVIVRVATPEDAERVAAIYVESWNDGFGDLVGRRVLDAAHEARWRATLGFAPTRWWVALHGATIVGFVGVGPSRDPIDPTLGELDTIAVAPAHWRGGIGRSLMTVALRALAAEYTTAIVWTVAGYGRAFQFYEAMGWHRDGGVRADGREISFRRSLTDVAG
jgi:GNAT superfamily N-acetyltransferase